MQETVLLELAVQETVWLESVVQAAVWLELVVQETVWLECATMKDPHSLLRSDFECPLCGSPAPLVLASVCSRSFIRLLSWQFHGEFSVI